MQHLLLENAAQAHNYRHGIYWCKLKCNRVEDMPPMVLALARALGANFTLIDIDGFDELFARELWQLHQDADARPAIASSAVTTPAPTLDMGVINVAGLMSWIGQRFAPASSSIRSASNPRARGARTVHGSLNGCFRPTSRDVTTRRSSN